MCLVPQLRYLSKCSSQIYRAYYGDSLLRSGSKVFFSGGEDPSSNVSVGTGLPATAESAGASARYHTQDGHLPGEAVFCALLARVACVTCVSKDGVQDVEV